MEKNTSAKRSFRPCAYSPFDDSAVERQRRMGLILDDGTPDRDAVTVLARVLAGQYFDDLCDFCQDADAVLDVLRRFLGEAEGAPPQRRFLLLCLQYDAIYRPLPDPVWWLSGNQKLAGLFSAGFVAHLRRLAEEGR